MQNSEAAEHLRDVLSKPPPKTPTHPRVPPSKTVATSDQGARAPSSTTPFPKRTLTSLEYPTVDVPGASPKPAPVATPSSSPPSIFGKGVFGSPAAPSGLTPKKSPAKNHGGGFLKFSRGRSALDANEDEFGGHNDTATTLEREQPSSRPSRATPTRLFSGTNPPSVGGAPKVLPGLASIFHSGSPAKNAGGNALLQSSTRDSLSLKDGDFEHRKYIATRPKKSALAATDTPSPHLETKHKRAVSWVDQVANGHISAPSPSSDLDLKIEQAAHGSNDARPPPLHRAADTDSESTGSTVSLNSPFASKVSVVLTTPAPQATKVSQLLRDSTLAASRNLSTFKGTSMWDPDDDEWADVDASRIVETFKASFKDPGQYSPRKASALSGWGSTITSFLPSSPTKRAESQKLREEENLRDKLDMLQNTYYSDPDGDLCDTVMKGVHLTGGAYFEATTSARKAHVVDLEAYFKAEDPLLQVAAPRLCDAVATLLSHTSKACLEAFLDPGVEEFVYRREVERSKAGSILVVRRKGNSVVVSFTYYPRLCFGLCQLKERRAHTVTSVSRCAGPRTSSPRSA
jgi:hypothetical protein